MNINKLIFAGQTLMDLTQDTVSPGTLLEGITAHAANGSAIVGTLKVGAGAASVEITSGVFSTVGIAGSQDLSTAPITIQHKLTGAPDFFLFYTSRLVENNALHQVLALRAMGDDFANQSVYSMIYGKKGGGLQKKIIHIQDYNENTHDVDRYITMDDTEVRIQTPEKVLMQQYGNDYAWVAGRSIKK